MQPLSVATCRRELASATARWENLRKGRDFDKRRVFRAAQEIRYWKKKLAEALAYWGED